MNLQALRNTAALIANAAVEELYPEIDLLEVNSDDLGFCCEFSFPHPVHAEIIELKMKEITQRKEPISSGEMVPFSASEMFKDKKYFLRAKKVASFKDLVPIVRIGGFCDLSLGEYLETTEDLRFFKIEAQKLEKKRMRIQGWCHFSKADLKQFLKNLSAYETGFEKGKKLGYWKEGLFLPLGLQKKEALIQFLKKDWFQGAFEVSAFRPEDRTCLHQELQRPKVAEIFKSEEGREYLHISFFGISSEEMTSFLHLIGKTLTILGFNHSVSQKGFEDCFTVLDAVGRNQVLVRVKKEKSVCVVTACMEQILEQMIEQNLRVELEN